MVDGGDQTPPHLERVRSNRFAMQWRAQKMVTRFNTVTILTGGLGIAALVMAASLAGTSRQATALPAYAQQTKLPCGSCHVNATGGGGLKAQGKKFQANGHKLK
jgi:hypothetical protein